MAQGTFDPLESILTPAQITARRQQQAVNAMLNAQNARTGREAGAQSVGTGLGLAIGGLFARFGKDPEMDRARENEAVLRRAQDAATGVENPFDKRIAVMTAAANEFADQGQFTYAEQLREKALQLQIQQLELKKLGGDAKKAVVEGDAAEAAEAASLESTKTSTEKTKFDLEEARRQSLIPKTSSWQRLGDPMDFRAVDTNNPRDVAEAREAGYAPEQINVSVQSPNVASIRDAQAAPTDVRQDLTFGLNTLDNLSQMRELSTVIKGFSTSTGAPNPNAVVQYLGGRIGVGDATLKWNALENSMRADVQALIKGTPSNKDQEIFEKLVPTFWEPENVKRTKIDLLEKTQKNLVQLQIGFLKHTKQAVPEEIVSLARSRGVDVGSVPAMTGEAVAQQSTAMAKEVTRQLAGAQSQGAKSDKDMLKGIIDRARASKQ
jgi:hypothetical protein